MYYSIVRNPASPLAIADEVYSHLQPELHCRSCPISCRATWSCNPPRILPMWGVTTQVSVPKSSTACSTALKKKPYTCGSDPSLLIILVLLFHTALALDKFLTTVGQLSSTTNITRPRYRKEVTISRGIP